MRLTTHELRKQIAQQKQSDYIYRLLDACMERIDDLESIKHLLTNYMECASLGYPSECNKIIENIMEILECKN